MPWHALSRRIPANNAGTRVSLGAMRELAKAGAHHPDVIRAAHDVVRRVPERDDVATMRALLADVRSRMRYTPDPMNLELVKAPWVSLGGSERWGIEPMDCDDASVLLSSMLGAVGIPSKFTVAAVDSSAPGAWSHVYVTARTTDGRWVPLDPIVRDFAPGQEVPSRDLTGPRRHFPAALSGLGAKKRKQPLLRNQVPLPAIEQSAARRVAVAWMSLPAWQRMAGAALAGGIVWFLVSRLRRRAA